MTIYVKTTPLTQEIGASRIALKNLGHQALEQLKAAGVDKRRLWPIEEVINHLVDDDAFWAIQANSLALFATPDGLLTYRLANHIPDQVHVSDRFHIQPLLRAVTFPHSAFILVLGENGVKLYQLDADTEPAAGARAGSAQGCRRRAGQDDAERPLALGPHSRFGRPELPAPAICPHRRPGAAPCADGPRPAADHRRHRSAGLHVPPGQHLSASGAGRDQGQFRTHGAA